MQHYGSEILERAQCQRIVVLEETKSLNKSKAMEGLEQEELKCWILAMCNIKVVQLVMTNIYII